MPAKPFASSEDTAEKEQTLAVPAEGVYALTAGGDPNVGAIEGEDFLVRSEALATPIAARRWLDRLREYTDKPIKYLSHYHAVRVLGASAFEAETIVTHDNTRALVAEHGKQGRETEFDRMPRLAEDADSVPGLTWPTLTFSDELTIDLGGDRGDLVLRYCGRGHTEGDIVAWLPRHEVLFASDLVEVRAGVYTGDAFHLEWSSSTPDRIRAFGARAPVGGRGAVSRGPEEVDAAIEQTRAFLDVMIREVGAVQRPGGTLKQAFDVTHEALVDGYGHWPIFEHCLPFDVSRLWDELFGTERPVIRTATRDREVWNQLQD